MMANADKETMNQIPLFRTQRFNGCRERPTKRIERSQNSRRRFFPFWYLFVYPGEKCGNFEQNISEGPINFSVPFSIFMTLRFSHCPIPTLVESAELFSKLRLGVRRQVKITRQFFHKLTQTMRRKCQSVRVITLSKYGESSVVHGRK